jgi:hypothetical protein
MYVRGADPECREQRLFVGFFHPLDQNVLMRARERERVSRENERRDTSCDHFTALDFFAPRAKWR